MNDNVRVVPALQPIDKHLCAFIKKGDFIKAAFAHESMWCKVLSVTGDTYFCEIRNEPYGTHDHGLIYGSSVTVYAHEVLDILDDNSLPV